MNVTLRQLKAFICVARLSSFAAAAQELSVTPSALSAIIRELENLIELRLFIRSTRQVVLSNAGKEFLPCAQQVMQELENARRCVVDLRQQRRGSVRIVATQVMFWTMLPAVFAAFNKAHPGIALIPTEVSVNNVLSALEAGKADVAFFAERRSQAGLRMQHLFDTSTHLVCHRNHPLAGRRKANWSEVHEEPLIFIGPDAKARTQAALSFKYDFPRAYEVATGTTALGLVSAEMGAAVILGLIKPVLKPLGLHIVPLVAPVLQRRIMLYTQTRKLASEPTSLFAEFCTEFFRKKFPAPSMAAPSDRVGS
jgi:DNA-binding transcriptional LysR family regulator